jgi:hypothetical protein
MSKTRFVAQGLQDTLLHERLRGEMCGGTTSPKIILNVTLLMPINHGFTARKRLYCQNIQID